MNYDIFLFVRNIAIKNMCIEGIIGYEKKNPIAPNFQQLPTLRGKSQIIQNQNGHKTN